MHDILSTAKDLRVLKSQLPSWHGFQAEEPDYSDLEDCLQDTTWSSLYELSLNGCVVQAQYLIDLCMRHKATLRRLSLSDIVLLDGDDVDWKDVLTSLSGQLPELRKIKLRGAFFLGDEVQLSFEGAGVESRRIAPYRDALENFVVKGGPWPSGDPNVLPDQGDYPDESYNVWKAGQSQEAR